MILKIKSLEIALDGVGLNKNNPNGSGKQLAFLFFAILSFVFAFKGVPLSQKQMIPKDVITFGSNLIGTFLVGFCLSLSFYFISVYRGNLKKWLVSPICLVVSLIFCSIFHYTTPKGVFSNFLFLKRMIPWHQVEKVELDIFTRSKGGGSTLIYDIKSAKGFTIDINDHRIYGDLIKVDQILTERKVRFDIEKLKNNRYISGLKSQDKIVSEKHLRK